MTYEPNIVDIDTGLMICNASHENIFLGELNVPCKSSERQLTNYWIRAPPLVGSDHVTPERLAALTRWSLGPSGQKSSSGVLAIGRLPVVIIFVAFISALIISSSSSSVSLLHLRMHRTHS